MNIDILQVYACIERNDETRKQKTTAMFANIDVLYHNVCLEGKDRPDSMTARHTFGIQLAELT